MIWWRGSFEFLVPGVEGASRHVATTPTAQTSNLPLQASIASPPIPWAGTSFDGAGESPLRSQALAALNSNWEITMAQLRAMQVKSRSLRNNLTVYRNIIKTWVEFAVGWGLLPMPRSGNKAYDARAKAYWLRWSTKRLFDRRRVLDHCGQQTVAASDMMVDGEIFRVKMLDARKRCVRKFYRTEQIGGLFGGTLAGNGWWNGIQYDEEGAPLAYEFRQNSTSGVPFYAASGKVFFPDEVQHIFDPERGNQQRGLPWCYSGLNDGMDAIDINSLAIAKDKINTALFQALETPTGATPGSMEKNMAATAAARMGLQPARRTFDTQASFPATGEMNVIYIATDTGKLYRWTGASYAETTVAKSDTGTRYLNIHGTMIPVFRTGEKIVPHNGGDSLSARDMLEYLFTSLAAGFCAPVQLFWNMATAGGAAVRGTLELGKRSFERTQRLLVGGMCQDDYENVLAQGILAYYYPADFPGVEPLQPPPGVTGWDVCTWRGPRDLTVDRGREGKMYLELIRAGLMSRQEWWSLQNEDPDEMETLPNEELLARRDDWVAKGLPEDKFWLREFGAQGTLSVRDEESGPGGAPSVAPSGFGNFSVDELAQALAAAIKDHGYRRL